MCNEQTKVSIISVGALIRETQNSDGRKQVIHKLAIAQKECKESGYWLKLFKEHFI